MTWQPTLRSFSRFACTMGWASMCTFMEGTTSKGARVASATVVRTSSAMPAASLATALAVAGATTSRSALSARLIWPISDSWVRLKRSVATGSPERVWKLRGVTNSAAALVITTRTEQGSWTRSLTISNAL